MRIAVVGAGAIGSYLANGLHRRGHDLTVVARPEYVDGLARNGLRVLAAGQASVACVPVVDRLTQPADLVLLAVKTQDLAQACEAVVPVAGGATALTLQNGVQADAIASSILNPDTIVGGVAVCAVTCLEPGVATVELPGWVILGSPSSATNGRLRMTADILREVIPTFVTPNLSGARWTKLIANLANGLSAATGLSLAELGRSRLGRILAIRVMREGHRVARAAGVRLDRHVYGLGLTRGSSSGLAMLQGTVTNLLPMLPEPISVALLSLAGRSSLGRAKFRGSTWQSLARGRTTEIDFLNGEIVRLGAAIGIDTPYNLRVLEAVHTAERSKRCASLSELWPSVR